MSIADPVPPVSVCNLPEILSRAKRGARLVDVQDSEAVTIHVDDAYEIGNLLRDDVSALVAELIETRRQQDHHKRAADAAMLSHKKIAAGLSSALSLIQLLDDGQTPATAATVERLYVLIPTTKR